MKAVIIHVYGRVQNIGFRRCAIEIADQLDIKGFVRNEPDRSVYIEAEGEEANLNQFIQWCYQGPSWSDVTEVKVADWVVSDYKKFSVKY